MSPVVFHYANILFLSLIALIPTQTWESFGIVIAVASIASFGYSLLVLVRVHRNSISDLSDRLGYGAVPMLCYATGLISSWLIFKAQPAGLDLLAAAALALLVANIRNAWDLMISLARRVKPRLNVRLRSERRTHCDLRAGLDRLAVSSRRPAPSPRYCRGWRAASRRLAKSACGRSRARWHGRPANRRSRPASPRRVHPSRAALDRDFEIDLLAPGQSRGRDRQRR